MNVNEEQELVRLLGKLEAGFVPFEVFLELMRLVTSSTVELVVFKLGSENNPEVLLVPRDPEYPHPYWKDSVHIPGAVLRPGDADDGTLGVSFERLIHGELQGLVVSSPKRVMTQYRKSERGSECSQVYMATTQEQPKEGGFYSVDALPENIIHEHKEPIRKAAELFAQSQY